MDRKFIIFIIASVGILFIGNYFTSKSVKNRPIAVPSPAITAVATAITSDSAIQTKPAPSLPKTAMISKEIKNGQFSISGNSRGLLDKIIINGFNNDNKDVNLIWNEDNSEYFDLKLSINNSIVDTKNFDWSIQESENRLDFTSNISGALLEKSISIQKQGYISEIKIKIKNPNSALMTAKNIRLNWGPSKTKGSEILQAAILDKGKVTRIKTKKSLNQGQYSTDDGWIGIQNHYFCSIFFLEPNETLKTTVTQFPDQTLGLEIMIPDKEIAPNSEYEFSIRSYFGPQNYQDMKVLNRKLEKIVDFGMFHTIGIWMLYILKYFYSLTKNYGVAIILLTLLIRAILWWPTHNSYTSMKKMQTAMNRMQPRLKTIKDLYKNDPQKLNEETMKLYKEYQINPMGGCLPMLLQMPVFFALYATLSGAVELKGADFVWIWKDLSMKDPMYILPIAMGISMFIQQKMSNAPAATPEAAAQQKMMLYMMPIMLTVFSFGWPSGLLLYWVVSNIISIGQQVIINRVEV